MISIVSCVACNSSRIARSYYHCNTCNVDFHKICYLYPPEIRHPFDPLHPLKFTFSSPNYSYSDLHHSKPLFLSWLREGSDSQTESDMSEDASISDAKCKCCQKKLGETYYHCSICDLSINLPCTRNPPPLTILNPKSHKHLLTIFPRRILLPCDACGLSLEDPHDHVYTCQTCNYMVHKTCIYLPRVIKITRHPHRLSFSTSLPSGLLTCGVCRRPVNVACGQFSCHNGCDYAVHSQCAVNGRVWDGIDLEGVPEDHDEDTEPFSRIDDKTIQHFSHEHHLRLQMNNGECDEDGLCQACVLPVILSTSFYSCLQCNFLLHEECASLPRKKEHHLHQHPLILHPIPPEPFKDVWSGWNYLSGVVVIEGMFKCNGCKREGSGFVYRCSKKGCHFQLDTRCASLPDPVIHGSHQHDLFFNLTKGECMRCKYKRCSPFYLECMKCKLFIGLKCASLPSLIHYKHDKHPLTLCYGEEDTSNGQY